MKTAPGGCAGATHSITLASKSRPTTRYADSPNRHSMPAVAEARPTTCTTVVPEVGPKLGATDRPVSPAPANAEDAEVASVLSKLTVPDCASSVA